MLWAFVFLTMTSVVCARLRRAQQLVPCLETMSVARLTPCLNSGLACRGSLPLLGRSHLVRMQTPSSVAAKPSQKRSSLLPGNFRCAVLFPMRCSRHFAGLFSSPGQMLRAPTMAGTSCSHLRFARTCTSVCRCIWACRCWKEHAWLFGKETDE